MVFGSKKNNMFDKLCAQLPSLSLLNAKCYINSKPELWTYRLCNLAWKRFLCFLGKERQKILRVVNLQQQQQKKKTIFEIKFRPRQNLSALAYLLPECHNKTSCLASIVLTLHEDFFKAHINTLWQLTACAHLFSFSSLSWWGRTCIFKGPDLNKQSGWSLFTIFFCLPQNLPLTRTWTITTSGS